MIMPWLTIKNKLDPARNRNTPRSSSMKIAVISCIHGKYEALNAVLSDIDKQRADKIFCLGDLVGYGPHPNAVSSGNPTV